MKPREQLLALWKDVTARLEGARALLPAAAVAGPEGASIGSYREFMEHNELELALDELELLGDANPVPDDFWRGLLAAAELMKLDRRAQRISSRLERR